MEHRRQRFVRLPILVATLAAFAALALPSRPFAEPVAGKPAAKPLAQAPFDWLRRAASDAAAARRQRLAAVTNWGYWLSSFEVAGVEAAPHDLMVVDNGVSANRRFIRERTVEEVARMKRRPDGSRRLLLAYLSFGEAERYRAYWRADWYDPAKRPPWLGEPNPDWDGNYAVRYWDPEWQQLIFGGPESSLDVILGQGFDGVYLDRADAYLDWEKRYPSARADMAAFLRRLADYARRKNPDFLVVMQNAEELLDDPGVLDRLDGVAKEDLLYGVGGAGVPNRPHDVAHLLQQLRLARDAGRTVLVVEYVDDPAKMESALKRTTAERFLPQSRSGKFLSWMNQM
jgi:cysteinyl-tRNA synthetase